MDDRPDAEVAASEGGDERARHDALDVRLVEQEPLEAAAQRGGIEAVADLEAFGAEQAFQEDAPVRRPLHLDAAQQRVGLDLEQGRAEARERQLRGIRQAGRVDAPQPAQAVPAQRRFGDRQALDRQAAQGGQQVGGEAVAKAAEDLGVTSKLNLDPSLALGSSGITLLELTSAYAGVAVNAWPVEPHAFKQEEQGWIEWLFSGPRSFSSRTHQMLMDLLGATVSEGTGRAARLSIPAYGKTGTSQDNRDALFVGFAGDLVVGVWIGNDDNSPLRGVNGGGLPARIWRDFMSQAISGAAPKSKPKPSVKPDPEGPIAPLDLPELPVNLEKSDIRFDEKEGVTVNTEVGGVPLDINLGRDGVAIQPGQQENEQRR